MTGVKITIEIEDAAPILEAIAMALSMRTNALKQVEQQMQQAINEISKAKSKKK